MGHSRRLSEFDPFDPGVVEDPWDFFAALREQAPAYRLAEPLCPQLESPSHRVRPRRLNSLRCVARPTRSWSLQLLEA